MNINDLTKMMTGQVTHTKTFSTPNSPSQSNPRDDMPNHYSTKLYDWLIKNDEELLDYCLRMFYDSDGWDLADCCDSIDSETYHRYCVSTGEF